MTGNRKVLNDIAAQIVILATVTTPLNSFWSSESGFLGKNLVSFKFIVLYMGVTVYPSRWLLEVGT